MVCPDRGLNPDLPHTRHTLYLYATVAVIINLKFRNQISLNYEENTVDAEFLVLNGKGTVRNRHSFCIIYSETWNQLFKTELCFSGISMMFEGY